MNMINDHPSSNQPSITVDSRDHIWLAHKAEPKVGSDELVIKMRHYRADNDTAEDKTVTDPEGWHFWPQAAVNSDGMLMVGWAHTQNQSYEWRLYNTETKTWTEVFTAGPGIPTRPWAAFWSKMVAHGENFYWAVMDPGRVLHLLKFDKKAMDWDDLGVVSNGGVEYHDAYAGYDKMLIAWSQAAEPSNVYLTTVAITPSGPPPVYLGEGAEGVGGRRRSDHDGFPGRARNGQLGKLLGLRRKRLDGDGRADPPRLEVPPGKPVLYQCHRGTARTGLCRVPAHQLRGQPQGGEPHRARLLPRLLPERPHLGGQSRQRRSHDLRPREFTAKVGPRRIPPGRASPSSRERS